MGFLVVVLNLFGGQALSDRRPNAKTAVRGYMGVKELGKGRHVSIVEGD
jgi:hypothetical protein